MMKKPNKKTVLIVSVLIILCLGIWTLWGNIALEVNEYEIVSDRIPEAFTGFRIAQVSDLHNKDFGERYGQLLTLLSEINPDIIVVTGDLIDSRQTDLDIALEFAWQAGKIARVYYVSGNHEARIPEYEDLKEAKMEIPYRPASFVAEDLADEFLIEESSKTANVIELGCTDYERARGKDMLNTLIRYYNEEALSYQKSEATKTLAFLDGRIENLLRELATIEDKIEAYKTKVQLMDGEHDVQFYVEQMKDLQTKMIELEGQANVVDLMAAFVKDTANRYAMVPMLLTLDAGGEGNPLSDYNTILLERSRVIKNSSINNPLVGTLSKQADQLRVSVIKTITNTQEGLQASLKDIRSKVAMIYDKMGSYPVAERQYVELKRDQEITQGVYLLLLQKREETALVLGKMNEKAKVLDDAYVKSRPIGPRKLYAALAMMLLTIIIPVGFLCCKQMYIALKDEFLRQKSER